MLQSPLLPHFNRILQLININTTIQKFVMGQIVFENLLCSPRLHLFDEKIQ